MTFEESYTLYSKDVWRFAYFLSGDPTLADDITSESFVRLWAAPISLRDRTLKSYLFTIAKNLYLDNRRSSGRLVELDEHAASDGVSMEEQLDHSNRLKQVLKGFTRLRDDEQTTLILRADGKSYEEIASQLGIRPDAAKMRVHRARRKLLEEM